MARQIESKLQSECLRWLALQHPSIYAVTWATPNGGKRDGRTAARLKKEGVKAGVPDLFVAKPYDGYHGLFIEMKVGDNKLTDKQKDMFSRLASEGYKCVECRSFDEFVCIFNK